jgi:hypothetical protein
VAEPGRPGLRRGLRRLSQGLVAYGVFGLLVAALGVAALVWVNSRVSDLRSEVEVTLAQRATTLHLAAAVLQGVSTTATGFGVTVDQTSRAVATAAGSINGGAVGPRRRRVAASLGQHPRRDTLVVLGRRRRTARREHRRPGHSAFPRCRRPERQPPRAAGRRELDWPARRHHRRSGRAAWIGSHRGLARRPSAAHLGDAARARGLDSGTGCRRARAGAVAAAGTGAPRLTRTPTAARAGDGLLTTCPDRAIYRASIYRQSYEMG